MTDLRYPIGPFEYKEKMTKVEREHAIDKIAGAPERLFAAIKGLDEEQLNTPYRPDGWTIRQVIHHVADSHMNSFIRFKLALTEDGPTIKPYDENLWASLVDGKDAPISYSLDLLTPLHERWVLLLRSLTDADYDRKFFHPERGALTLDKNLGIYAWHGNHHIAHVTSLRERMGW